MFPIRDNIPAKSFPAVTIWLIIINALCFAYEVQLGHAGGRFLADYGFVPARYLAMQAHNVFDLSRFGPLFASMFLHGGLVHLLSNMWMLWIFGDNVEDSMGHGRYLIFYLLCGVISVLAQTWAAPHATVPLVGASGAIAGVLGAYIVTYPRARILTLVHHFLHDGDSGLCFSGPLVRAAVSAGFHPIGQRGAGESGRRGLLGPCRRLCGRDWSGFCFSAAGLRSGQLKDVYAAGSAKKNGTAGAGRYGAGL